MANQVFNMSTGKHQKPAHDITGQLKAKWGKMLNDLTNSATAGTVDKIKQQKKKNKNAGQTSSNALTRTKTLRG